MYNFRTKANMFIIRTDKSLSETEAWGIVEELKLKNIMIVMNEYLNHCRSLTYKVIFKFQSHREIAEELGKIYESSTSRSDNLLRWFPPKKDVLGAGNTASDLRFLENGEVEIIPLISGKDHVLITLRDKQDAVRFKHQISEWELIIREKKEEIIKAFHQYEEQVSIVDNVLIHYGQREGSFRFHITVKAIKNNVIGFQAENYSATRVAKTLDEAVELLKKMELEDLRKHSMKRLLEAK